MRSSKVANLTFSYSYLKDLVSEQISTKGNHLKLREKEKKIWNKLTHYYEKNFDSAPRYSYIKKDTLLEKTDSISHNILERNHIYYVVDDLPLLGQFEFFYY